MGWGFPGYLGLQIYRTLAGKGALPRGEGKIPFNFFYSVGIPIDLAYMPNQLSHASERYNRIFFFARAFLLT